MIRIGNVLVSDQVASEEFVCDLHKCKGGCCVDGDAGAPLEKEELAEIADAYPHIKPLISDVAVQIIEKQGKYLYDREFGWVTPTIDSGMCVYGYRDAQGVVKCSFEKAYLEGKTRWKKPISCHLFPVKIKKSKKFDTDLVNYEPREDLCQAACTLGKKLKVPVYQFLKEPLTRKFGPEFYEALAATAAHLNTTDKK
ncbi:MAG: DUF3109 family protein [Bacteroidota bacterium]|nr:DUF3109 family protein [Bacteroidota bacterium]